MTEEAAVSTAMAEDDPAQLARGRIRELAADPELPGAYGEWVRETAAFLAETFAGDTLSGQECPPEDVRAKGKTDTASFNEDRTLRPSGEPVPAGVQQNWLNYDYAKTRAGESGQLLCFLRSELLAVPAWMRQKKTNLADAYAELFLLAEGSLAAELADGIEGKLLAESLQETIASMYRDFLELFFEESSRDPAFVLPLSLNPGGLGLPLAEEMPQLLRSHREDAAVFLDRAWMERFFELAAAREKGRQLFERVFLDALSSPAEESAPAEETVQAAADDAGAKTPAEGCVFPGEKNSARPAFGTRQRNLLEKMRVRLKEMESG